MKATVNGFIDQITRSVLEFEHWEMYLRLSLSAIFGFFIGLERTSRSKPAGIKTYTFVTVASTLLTLVSIHTVDRYSLPGRTMMDPMRLTAQIVSGLGFLGAGLIIQRGRSVKGLTSAAMVFFSGGIGIAIGAGYYGMTAFTMFLMYAVLRIGHRLEHSPRWFNQTDDPDEEIEIDKRKEKKP
ncbi:MgtC/SapB family protein [Aneurinibacillus aneurinilyticus]|uniref:SapB family protein n=2 Tax=Aneurinibacillus aneurinilyticus TaxID=1391 RepID=U1YAJ7_ANEAE|nr:MgtC/SapB family protein [Aneurinibacillus aneurinilyticus]ERI09157.1 SapB family protein [Aneurinibacillus aneurinilyticus ATCC 12856]